MLSHHASGLAVIAAPNRPAEMRTFDPDMVTRLLDLVSSHFDYVVIDMPRTWFSWTDNVLLGSNQLFIVSEMTVPSLRHAKGLVAAIRERLGDGPQPQVIVNRFEQRMFAPGLKKSDIEQALGGDFAGTIPNNYQLVREAIDRGVPLDEVKPGNKITAQLKQADAAAERRQGRRAGSVGADAEAQPVVGEVSAAVASTSQRDGQPVHRSPRAGARAARRSPERAGAAPAPHGRGRRAARADAEGQGAAAASDNPLLSDKLLDAKVRLHRRLIEEINLSALEKLPEDEMRPHIQQLVTQYIVVERLALNTNELNDFVSEILDEMTGPRPAGAAAQGPVDQRHPDQRPRMHLRRARRPAGAGRLPLQGRGASAAHHQQDRLGGRPPGR